MTYLAVLAVIVLGSIWLEWGLRTRVLRRWRRLLATLLGAAIAFAAIAVGRLLLGRHVLSADAEPPAEDADATPG